MAAALTSSLRPLFLRSLPLFRPDALIPTLQPYLAWASPILALPALRSLWELFPPFLLAVPKKKTSHSRKAMRSANKGLKDKLNIVNCPGCGNAKLAHHLCSTCYSEISRGWKAEKRKELQGQKD
ncbi:hypothetical protein M422DRAFT_207683 [Sphaerobolus stellatus SS14]|uniref:Large ribosomal subunit protein bL32m n=1 Tax=Sphaerobolus stellatus (strain SS14) TaxID=990650 RepID=A0A0C9W2P1_SPHS4|nr:hypothetical protein M422DRAFT_207683 [Sphaerobolus stellatus SS14]